MATDNGFRLAERSARAALVLISELLRYVLTCKNIDNNLCLISGCVLQKANLDKQQLGCIKKTVLLPNQV